MSSRPGLPARRRSESEPELLTPAEVAAKFRVDPKTVSRWGKKDNKKGKGPKLRSILTPGGHRRYYAAQVRAILHRTPDNVATWEQIERTLPKDDEPGEMVAESGTDG